MQIEYFTLGDAARILDVQPYVITYLLNTRKLDEPQRVGGRRLFTAADLSRIAVYLKLAPVEGKEADAHA